LEYSALERRARRIKLGMTKEQVNQIMGPPFLSPPPQYSPFSRNTHAREVYTDRGRVWEPHVWIEVEYLEGGVRYLRFDWVNGNSEHWVPPKK